MSSLLYLVIIQDENSTPSYPIGSEKFIQNQDLTCFPIHKILPLTMPPLMDHHLIVLLFLLHPLWYLLSILLSIASLWMRSIIWDAKILFKRKYQGSLLQLFIILSIAMVTKALFFLLPWCSPRVDPILLLIKLWGSPRRWRRKETRVGWLSYYREI